MVEEKNVGKRRGKKMIVWKDCLFSKLRIQTMNFLLQPV